MLLSDGEIKEELQAGSLVIKDFVEESLQAASYDMRVGATALVSGEQVESDLKAKGAVVLGPGRFGLLTTFESLTVPPNIAGHLGIRTYYTKKGLVLLGGLQIVPGFEGVLVLGVYNASPRSMAIEYLAPFCTVEFYKLVRAAEKPFMSGPEQRKGGIPRMDKDYLRTIETQSLSELSENMRQLSANVGSLTTTINRWVVPTLIGVVLAVVGFGIASLAT